MAEQSSSNAPAKGIILLFGLARSGTTWLGKLFDSHPDTLYRHEPDTWRPLDMPRYPFVADSGLYASQIGEYISEMPQINVLRVAGKKPLFEKSYLSRPRSTLMRAGVSIARLGSQIKPEFPVWMYANGDGAPQRRVVWKSIQSMGRLGVLLDVLENAQAVQILRHPCGFIRSVERGLEAKSFSDNTPTSEDYGIFKAVIGTPLGDRYGLSLDGIKTLTPAERQAWRWVLLNEKSMLECAPTERWLCVRYEDLCQHPVAEMHRILDFAGLTMSPQTREFISASTTRNSNGYYSVYRDSYTAAWRWREEMQPETIARVMAIVKRTRIGQYYADEPTPPLDTAADHGLAQSPMSSTSRAPE